jgi:hypothetical protein
MPNKVISYLFIFLATIMLLGHNFIPHTHGICHHSSCEKVESNSHDVFHDIQDALGQGQECNARDCQVENSSSYSFKQALLLIAYTLFSFLFGKTSTQIHSIKTSDFFILPTDFLKTFSYRGPPSLS